MATACATRGFEINMFDNILGGLRKHSWHKTLRIYALFYKHVNEISVGLNEAGVDTFYPDDEYLQSCLYRI